MYSGNLASPSLGSSDIVCSLAFQCVLVYLLELMLTVSFIVFISCVIVFIFTI